MSVEADDLVDNAFATMDSNEQAYVKKTVLLNRILFTAIGAGLVGIFALIAFLVKKGKRNGGKY